MGIVAEEILADWHASLAALAWQIDMGLSDVIGEDPTSAYDLPDAAAQRAAAPRPATAPPVDTDAAPLQSAPAQSAHAMAAAATDLATLHDAVRAFHGCQARKGARSTVFAGGNPGARIMIISEPPDRDEDLSGQMFVGATGLLLDRMLAAIGLSRGADLPEHGVYLAPILPWRLPPGKREAEPDDIAAILPFVQRHIALAAPDVIVTMGNSALAALTGQRVAQRVRGQWGQIAGRAHLPMLHPADLKANPAGKRDAWADLLSLKDWLRRNRR